jgi:hypothetical protein
MVNREWLRLLCSLSSVAAVQRRFVPELNWSIASLQLETSVIRAPLTKKLLAAFSFTWRFSFLLESKSRALPLYSST